MMDYPFLDLPVGTYNQNVYLVSQDRVSNSITRRMLTEIQLEVIEFLAPTDLVKALPLSSPACFLIDFLLPEMTGLQLMTLLRQKKQFQPCVFTASRIDPMLIVTAMNQGGFGFVKKPFQQLELQDMIQRAINHDSSSHSYISTAGQYQRLREGLGNREHKIVQLLEQGRTAPEIANLLGLSKRTVENHRYRILRKFNLPTVVELIRRATILDVLRANGVME